MPTSHILPIVLLSGFLTTAGFAGAQSQEDRTQDRVAFPAHKMIGNISYVGTGTLNSYLVTTPQGHVLINTNFEETVPLLQASVEKLGYKMADIKIILGSHAHGDHMQADAVVKELTGGATVMAMEQDVPQFGEDIRIGHIATGVALAHLDFRRGPIDMEWRDGHAALARWYERFVQRPSMQRTTPHD